LETLNQPILIALNDSVSSQAVIDFIMDLSLIPKDSQIDLIHFFRKPSASEDLMGKKFTMNQPSKMEDILKTAKSRLVEKGFDPEKVRTELITEQYQTVADGIIEQVRKRDINLVVIGRKKMSKAEEFVMGDISVKLIRALAKAAVLVVKSK
jgi:nucleotide-binding universal stress UspA family protein